MTTTISTDMKESKELLQKVPHPSSFFPSFLTLLKTKLKTQNSQDEEVLTSAEVTLEELISQLEGETNKTTTALTNAKQWIEER